MSRCVHSAKVKYWESELFPALSFFRTSKHYFNYGAHLHDTLEIVWTLSDSAQMTVRGQRFHMSRGDALLIAPNEIHSGGTDGTSPFSFASLHIPYVVLEKLFLSNLIKADHILRMPSFQFIDSKFAISGYHKMKSSLRAIKSEKEQLLCLSDLLNKLFSFRKTVAGTVAPIKNYHPAIKRVQSFINSEFTQNIDLDYLATELNLHRRYIISLFKSATGIPPHQYQMALRVDLGRRLLERDLPLSNVASMAGFYDQSHFNRQFKKVYGITPGMFRDSMTPL